jgi:hypothetical protein
MLGIQVVGYAVAARMGGMMMASSVPLHRMLFIIIIKLPN